MQPAPCAVDAGDPRIRFFQIRMGQIDSDSCHSLFKKMNQHLCITACWSDGSVNFCLHYTLLSAQLLCCAARDSIVRQILPPLVL